MGRDTFISRTIYLGSIILLTAWTNDLFRAVPGFPYFPYWSNHYYPHHSSTLLLLALGEYFPFQQNTVPLTSICLLAGLSLTAYALVFRRRPHYFPSSLTAIRCCGPYTALSKRRTASSHSSRIPLASHSVRLKLSRCTSGYLHRPSFQYAASAASAAFPTSLPFPVLHLSRANAIPHGALAFQLRLAPGQRVPNSAYRHFQSISGKIVFFLYSRKATGLLSNSASSVVPVANVLACRRSLPPAKRRAGLSSIPTSLSPFNRVSRQHTVRLGQLSASPYPTPSLASSCFPWPLSVTIYRLPKSPCHMRHMELSRRVALDNLFPKAPLAAIPRTGSTRAFCRAYSLHATDSFLLPSVTPRLDSSATLPSHDQLCSTSSHHCC
jgi:hypothetical protein